MITVSAQRKDNTLIASPEGRLDGDNANEFLEMMEESILPGDRVILNLENLSYISSAGLRILAILATQAGKKQYRFCICAPSEPVDYVLRMSGFQKILTIHPDLETAEAA